jgi:hypothetical protein
MKSVKLAALFGALSLVFMGCPYESKVPIDDASNAKPDKTLTGNWEKKGDEKYLFTVKLEDNIYYVTKKNTEDASAEPTKYKGFLSDVGGVTFLNIRELSEYESSDVKYYLYRVEKKGDDRVKLRGITDNITEEFATSAELKAFIKKNMEISFFYNKDDDDTYYKND